MEPEPVALAVQGLTLHLSRCCFCTLCQTGEKTIAQRSACEACRLPGPFQEWCVPGCKTGVQPE